jgi:hypothetical protein
LLGALARDALDWVQDFAYLGRFDPGDFGSGALALTTLTLAPAALDLSEGDLARLGSGWFFSGDFGSDALVKPRKIEKSSKNEMCPVDIGILSWSKNVHSGLKLKLFSSSWSAPKLGPLAYSCRFLQEH